MQAPLPSLRALVPQRAAGAPAAGAAGRGNQVDLDPRQCSIKALKRERGHIDIGGRDDDRAAVQNHVGPALSHDGLKNRIEGDFHLTRCRVEARLDLGLTLLDAALECLLLRGEVLLPLSTNIRGKDRQLLLKLNGLALKRGLLGPQLGFQLLGQSLRLGEDVFSGSGALEKLLAVDNDDARCLHGRRRSGSRRGRRSAGCGRCRCRRCQRRLRLGRNSPARARSDRLSSWRHRHETSER